MSTCFEKDISHRPSLESLTVISLSEVFPSLHHYEKTPVRSVPGDAKSQHQKDKQHLYPLKYCRGERCHSGDITHLSETKHQGDPQSGLCFTVSFADVGFF